MKVLVVDDEPDVRALVASALGYARTDVEVSEAGDLANWAVPGGTAT